jgi:hypothetical protein
MKNIENKIQVLKENFQQAEGVTSLREYVENEREADPGFMSWLFSDGDVSDFGSNLTEQQEADYQKFLHKL